MKNGKKPDWAIEKHLIALKGTAFERCAPCPGCAGKLEGEHMRCSRAGAVPVPITAFQARRCNGIKPRLPGNLTEKKERKRVVVMRQQQQA